MELTESQARKLLLPLIGDDLFTIQDGTMFYNSVVFGNSSILLKAQNGVFVKFVDDRGFFTCDIGISFRINTTTNRRYESRLENLFKYLSLQLPQKPDNFLELIRIYSRIIRENKDKIFEAFDEKHREETNTNIRKRIDKEAKISKWKNP